MRLTSVLDVPAHVELAFEAGSPVAVNGVTMSVPELRESLATIAADHGFQSPSSDSAADASLAEAVVAPARAALAALSDPTTGVVRVTLHQGMHTVVEVSPSPVPVGA
jgi:hypothetical protein